MCAMEKEGNIVQTDFAFAVCCWKNENCPLGMKPVRSRVIIGDIREGENVSNFFKSFHTVSAIVISMGLLCHIRVAWSLRTKRTYAELVMEALIMWCILASDILAIFSAMYLTIETVQGMARAILIQFSFTLASQFSILLGCLTNRFRSSLDVFIRKNGNSMDERALKNRIYLFTSVITLLVPCGLSWGFIFRPETPPYLIRLVYLSNWILFRNDGAFLT